MKILIVTTDPEIALTLPLSLNTLGLMPCDVCKPLDARLMLKNFAFDAVVIDHPAVVRIQHIRAARITTPIVALTRRREDRVSALWAGADDALDHPADPRELIARLLAVVRRWRGYAESKIVFDDLTVDIGHGEASIGDERLALTKTEFAILEALALRRGRVITPAMWIDVLYPTERVPETQRIVDVFICKLRRKMFAASGGRDYIQNDWGRGYRLVTPSECVVQGVLKTKNTYRELRA